MANYSGTYPVGITGHRRLRKDGQVQALIDAALNEVQTLAQGKPLAGFSSLAEGADRLVVQRLLAYPSASFTAVLPLPAALYRQDFRGSISLVEFNQLLQEAVEVIELPGKPDRRHSYLEASRYILDKIKVLIAVWDGQPARGTGGTGQVVAEARQLEMPIAWIRPARGIHPAELCLERFSKLSTFTVSIRTIDS